jgi:hypothetical protein
VPATHHHGPHENNGHVPPIVSLMVEQIGKHVDNLEWHQNWTDNEIRALHRDTDDLRAMAKRTQEALEVFMASFVWEQEHPPPDEF